jgi:hypothetical protein
MKRMFILAAACLSLAACQSGTTPPPASNSTAAVEAPSASPSPAVATGACELSTTAMYAAEAAYNAPAAAYVSADAKGLLTAPVKAKVKPMLVEAFDWLKKARLFYSARDAVGFCGSTNSLKSLAGAALALLPAN